MHRSGTSAVAGVLHLCGLDLPHTLVPPGPANEKGFWESAAVKSVNDAALEGLGLNWRSLEAIDENSRGERWLARYRSAASKICKAEFKAGANPVIKEPRLCRLLPIWEPALEKLAKRMVYPCVLRHPLEVAQSLARRNDLDEEHALLLWARYSLDAEIQTRGKPRAFVSYSQLLDDWRSTVDGLRAALELPLKLGNANVKAVDEYLTPALRHHDGEDKQDFGKNAIVGDVYRILRGWSRGNLEQAGEYEELDYARQQLDRVGAAVSSMFEQSRHDRKRLANARAKTKEATQELQRAHRSLKDLDELRSAVADQSQAIAFIRDKFEADSAHEKLSKLRGELAKASLQLDSKVRAARDELAIIISQSRDDQETAFAAIKSGIESVGIELSQSALSSKKAQEAAFGIVHGSLESVRDELVGSISNAKDAQEAAFTTIQEQVCSVVDSVRELAVRNQALTAALENAAELTREIERLKAMLEETRKEATRHLSEIESRDEELKTAERQQRATSDELKEVKRKYRSMQQKVEQERERLELARSDLAQAQVKIAEFQRSIPGRIYMAVDGLQKRIRSGIARLTGARNRNLDHSIALVEQSLLFDRDWYLERYPDVASEGVDPVRHYIELGWREGRDPGPQFSTTAYLKSNADVASLGANPLLHYIEHGHSEARGAPEHAAPARPPTTPRQEFGPAAPCVRFPIEMVAVVGWKRAGRVPQGSELTLAVDGCTIGQFDAEPAEQAFAAAMKRTAWLSGSTDASGASDTHRGATGCQRLLDAWYAGQRLFRTRWRRGGGEAIAVRALQFVSGNPMLVGDGLVQSDLDVVDAGLVNPLFPILFVFTDPAGLIIGWEALDFPSLSRGGLHYPEAVALAQLEAAETLDVVSLGHLLSESLLRCRGPNKNYLVGEIAVDLRCADGTHPLFQPDVQSWLANVGRVSVSALNDTVRNGVSEFLAGAVEVESQDRRRAFGTTLIVSSDMVPTISVLTASSDGTQVAEPLAVGSVIVTAEDQSRPATLIDMGDHSLFNLADHPLTFPILKQIEGSSAVVPKVPFFALRAPPLRKIAEAEMLVPVAPPQLTLSPRAQPITWLLWPSEWSEATLAQALESLIVQTEVPTPSIVFVGSVPDALVAVSNAFDSFVRVAPSLEQTVAIIDTPLVAYLGPGVVLHDHRTSAFLATALDESHATTASAVVLSVEKRGQGWVVTPSDAGMMRPYREPIGGSAAPSDSLLIWRASWPCELPPRDLWMARTSSFAGWVQDETKEDAFALHLCSSLVTASYLQPPADSDAPFAPPRSSRAIQVGTLIG